MRSTGLFALALAALIPACGDDIKFPDQTVLPDPALNGVFPSSGFTGRTYRVEVSGDGTEFTGAPTLAFSGTGITVANVTLSSASDLFADITVTPDATLGKRDVTVGDLTLTSAFELKSPIEVLTDGQAEQGGFSGVLIINHDSENPFLGDLSIDAGTNSFFAIDTDSSTEFKIFATGFFDTDAVGGPVVVTDDLGTSSLVSRGADLTVAPRTATALAPPTKKNGVDLEATATLQGNTELFSFSPDTALINTEVFSNNATLGDPFLIYLEDGKWANARFYFPDAVFGEDDILPTTSGTTMFLVVADLNADDGYQFGVNETLFVDMTGRLDLAQTEPNNTPATAQDGTANSIVLYSGDLSDETDREVIKVHATTGQRIRVITTFGVFGNPAVDTQISLLDTNGTTVLVNNKDLDIAEDVTSAPVGADGDYFVRVQTSDFCLAFGCYTPAGEPFEVAILVEDPATFTANHASQAHAQAATQSSSIVPALPSIFSNRRRNQLH